MEDRETALIRKYGESKTTRIMMAPVPHVTSGLGLRKFQADGFFVDTSVHTDWRDKQTYTKRTNYFAQSLTFQSLTTYIYVVPQR